MNQWHVVHYLYLSTHDKLPDVPGGCHSPLFRLEAPSKEKGPGPAFQH